MRKSLFLQILNLESPSYLHWQILHHVDKIISSEEMLTEFIPLGLDIIWVWFGATDYLKYVVNKLNKFKHVWKYLP